MIVYVVTKVKPNAQTVFIGAYSSVQMAKDDLAKYVGHKLHYNPVADYYTTDSMVFDPCVYYITSLVLDRNIQ